MIKAQCFQYISYFGYLAIDRDLHGQHEARESVVVAAVHVNLRVRQEGTDLREATGKPGILVAPVIDYTGMHQKSTFLH